MALIPREVCEAAFRDAVRACNPTRLVEDAITRHAPRPPLVGLAVGKAALAMARGLPDVARGLCITNVDDTLPLPPRWRLHLAAHPLPDDTSVRAGLAALSLVESTDERDTLVALISGGTSSMLELPRAGLTLADLRTQANEAMARGVAIHELNALRASLSSVKGGKLAHRSVAPVLTLALSDVPGDDPHVIGSGPTVADRDGDETEVIAPLSLFGAKLHASLRARGFPLALEPTPLTDDVVAIAARLARETAVLAWGEPTVTLPAHPGSGGRAAQLALLLAQHLRGRDRSAFVAASDGADGNSNAAGAYVDGATWDALVAAGVDPARALVDANAAHALAAIDADFVPGSTGINHADVVVIG